MQEAQLDSWSRFVRDTLLAAVLARREETYRVALSNALGALSTSSEGGGGDGAKTGSIALRGVEVERLVLPAAAQHTPSLSLLRHESECVTRWSLEWHPPADQCAATVRVDGATFGRGFSVQCVLSDFRISGEGRVHIDRSAGSQGELKFSFAKSPSLDFKVAVVGSWMGSPLKPILVRLITRWLDRTVVEPTRIVRQLPGPQPLPPRPPPGDAAVAAADFKNGGGNDSSNSPSNVCGSSGGFIFDLI